YFRIEQQGEKRAPPVRVDDEAKKKLNWNMFEDRQRECGADTDQPDLPSCSTTPFSTITSTSTISTTSPSLFTPGGGGSSGRTTQRGEEVAASSSSSSSALSSSSSPPSLSLSVVPAETSALARVWKALVGEFSLQLARVPASSCDPDRERRRAFTLRRVGAQVSLRYSAHQEEEESSVGPVRVKEEEEEEEEETLCTIKCSNIQLEELDWLQKRGVMQLCHHPAKGGAIKVGIYLLEAGLSKPEFLGEGNSRLKKANQLMQKLMEYFYDFITPVAGGILADEMGLGKTVEVLALILVPRTTGPGARDPQPAPGEIGELLCASTTAGHGGGGRPL
ncbi:hypothetical protein CRUP_014605, partial [Coryphaenoides rupestris]